MIIIYCLSSTHRATWFYPSISFDNQGKKGHSNWIKIEKRKKIGIGKRYGILFKYTYVMNSKMINVNFDQWHIYNSFLNFYQHQSLQIIKPKNRRYLFSFRFSAFSHRISELNQNLNYIQIQILFYYNHGQEPDLFVDTMNNLYNEKHTSIS